MCGICFKTHRPVLRLPVPHKGFYSHMHISGSQKHKEWGHAGRQTEMEWLLPRWWSWCCGRWRRGGRSGRCASPSPGAGSSGPPCAGAWGSCRGMAVGTAGWRGCPSLPCAPESPSCPAEQETAPLLTRAAKQPSLAPQPAAFPPRCN